MITCALVRIRPCGLTTKPEPWAAVASGTLPSSKYDRIVTTPAERDRKIWAGAKPLPASGFATTTGAASPVPDGGWATTTVFVVVPPSQPVALPTASTATPPSTAATRAMAAAELERTGGPL